MPDYIYGRHSILEALRAGRAIEEILVAMGVHSRGALNELLAFAKTQNVPVRGVARVELDRLARDHQGVVARIADFQYAEIDDLLAVAHERG